MPERRPNTALAVGAKASKGGDVGFRGGREGRTVTVRSKAREGECPKEGEAQESQGLATRRNLASDAPNQQRD